MRDMKPPLIRDRPKVFLPKQKVLRLVNVPARCARLNSVRDRAILATLFWALLRVGELVRLRVEDVDLPALELQVMGKGGKVRRIPIHPKLAAELRSWLKVRPAGTPWLFPSRAAWHKKGGQLGEDAVQRMMRMHYVPASHLGVRVTPHTLRRSMARHLVIVRKVPVPVVQQLLGHKRMETTLVYVGVIQEDLKKGLSKV